MTSQTTPSDDGTRDLSEPIIEASNSVLGVTAGETNVETQRELIDVCLAMAEQCQRSLDIISRHLDPPLFDNEPFTMAVKALALRNRHVRVRLLIIDSRPLIRAGHRLVELANRLPSFIEIRAPGRESRHFNEAILVADNIGYIHRQFSDRYEATIDFSDRRVARRLSDRVDDMWERGVPDPNLRRLSL